MLIIRVGLLIGLIGVPPLFGALPPEAQALLDSLPKKSLTLDLVLSRAVGASDSFRAISAEKIRTEVSALRAKALLDYQFSLEGSLLDNQNEVISPFQPSRTKVSQATLGVSTLFESGTRLAAEVGHGFTSLGFTVPPGNPDPSVSVHQTTASLSVVQSLWKDFLGYATRRAIEAGALATQSAEFAFDESIEQWTLDLVEVYYNAWLAKSRAQASDTGVSRQTRLARITNVRAKRGTAERPDVIQVQSTLTQSKLQKNLSQENLNRVWRNLIISLKLPVEWIEIDPMLIPIELEDPTPEALAACGPASQPNPPPKETSSTEKAKHMAEAAKLSAERAESNANPDLTLSAALNANGLNPTGPGPTWGEAFRAEHPSWTVAVALKFPLGFSAQEAEMRSAQADLIRAEAMASDATSRLQVNWMNECAQLRRLNERVELLTETFRQQEVRAKLEERRFQVGRSQALQVIQADADTIQTELSLREAEVEVRMSAWRVRRMKGLVKPYLEKLLKNPPSLKVIEEKKEI